MIKKGLKRNNHMLYMKHAVSLLLILNISYASIKMLNALPEILNGLHEILKGLHRTFLA